MSIHKHWELAPEEDPKEVNSLAAALQIEPPLAALLIQRGVDTVAKAEKFFNPSLGDLHDPFEMKDMDRVIERIERAISEGERVMIYGDYDVDGTTATSLLLNFFNEKWLEKMMYYIPDRYAEGYGISEKGIDYAADHGVKLIITVDCGIKAVAEVEYAASRGIDFIVSDHHLADEQLPPAYAVLDPKRLDCNYPFKELSGCGVAFKIVQAFCQKRGIAIEEIAYLLDLVVVSIAADIVPLSDENRVLAYYGLLQLNSSQANLGLRAIINISSLGRQSIAIEDIIFKIGPRINATGRMEIAIDPDDTRAQSGARSAVKLMTARNADMAKKYIEKIEDFNIKRKNADRIVTIEARRIIKSDPHQQNRNCTILYKPEWMKGVVGIVASRLIESYYRPTVVLTDSNGMITGSARSVPGFDLYSAVESCSDLLENFGGHTYAVGLTMRPERLKEFCARFEAYVDEHINESKLEQTIKVNMPLHINQITPRLRSDLARLAPFGPGNTAPVFVTYGVRDSGAARRVGVSEEHIKLSVYESRVSNNCMDAIGFSLSGHYAEIASGMEFDVCYTISENHYGNRITPQLKLKDIVIHTSLRIE